ncbi:DsbA family protein [Pseudokineococcus sp. 1T1Z-3]|uniref:DsbA family protein n=1 Tax=Pseudokineococcus sp. 1T1Z-3 TaxID=3132745 RepID=UPI0030B75DEA
MSPDPRKPSKADRQADARAKARAMREQRERAARRKKLGLVTAAALAVAGLVAVVVVAVVSGREPAVEQATPPSFTESGGFVTGDESAPVSVVIYQDYQCPFCATFEQENSAFITELRDGGDISVTYHPINILSRLGDYSSRAASAAVCVAEEAPEQFVAFNDALYANQPEEGGGGLTDAQITSVAEEAGVPGEVDSCITSGRYTDWVDEVTADRDERVEGTPTVLVDDEVIDVRQFQAVVSAAVGGASTS